MIDSTNTNTEPPEVTQVTQVTQVTEADKSAAEAVMGAADDQIRAERGWRPYTSPADRSDPVLGNGTGPEVDPPPDNLGELASGPI